MQDEINNIFSKNKYKLENLDNDFLLSDFKKIKVHPSLKKYILAEIDYQLFHDILSLKKRSKFDYKSENIEKYFSLISEEIKNNKKFNISLISDLLHSAAEFNTNFLSRPNNTLLNFIFENKKVKSKSEIISKLKYVYYYTYICKIILSYLEKKQIQNFNRKEFAYLLKKIDGISKKTNTHNLLNTAINSMANYYNQIEENSNKIPFLSIQAFLEEKELTDFLQRLQLKYEFAKPKYLSSEEIKNLFELNFNSTSDSSDLNSNYNGTNENSDESQFNNIAENDKENIIPISNNVEAPNNETQEVDEVRSEESQMEQEKIPSDDIQTEIQEEENRDENSIKNAEENIDENNGEQKEEQSNEIEINEKPDVKSLIKNLIDIKSIFNSLFKQPNAFDSNDFLNDISLKKVTDFSEYKYDKFTLGENFIAEIAEEEEYIGIVEKENIVDETDKNADQIESEQNEVISDVESFTESETEINLESTQIVDKVDQEDNFEDNNSIDPALDINDSIDDFVQDQSNEEEFKTKNDEVDVDKVDKDEIQDMTNLVDEDKLKLIEDEEEEITEVFTDLTFLDKEEIEENPTEEIQNETQNEIQSEDEDIEYENPQDNSDTGVKVVYSSFNEMLLQKEMTNIIETIFDYDMEDYHKIIRTISNSSNEKEGIEITDTYCRSNHVDTFHEDVIEFKTYISDYFSQSQ